VRASDRILWLEDGRIVEDGSPAALLADPSSRTSAWLARQGGASRMHEEAG
jgi:ATP-binding cassette subfamily B protein